MVLLLLMTETYRTPTYEQKTTKIVAFMTTVAIGSLGLAGCNGKDPDSEKTYDVVTVHELANARDSKSCPVGRTVKLNEAIIRPNDIADGLYDAVDGPDTFRVWFPDQTTELPNTTSYTIEGTIVEPPCTLREESWTNQ